MKAKSTSYSLSTSYPVVFLTVFLGSLFIPFVTVSTELGDLLNKFKGKARFVTAYTETRLALGDHVFNRSLVGHDGWLNLTDEYAITSYQNVQPLSDSELQNIQLVLGNFQEYVEAHGGVFLFVVPPDKQTIYPEHVPTSIPRQEGSSRLDQLMTCLSTNGSALHVLDLRPTLLEAKKTDQLYFATDSHWNSMGAFFAYQKIIETLQTSFPSLSYHSISDYKVITYDPIPLDMPRIIGSTSLTEARSVLIPTYSSKSSIFSVQLPTKLMHFSQTDDYSAPTALMFTDSFFNALRPFIAEHFSRIVDINYISTPDISYLSWYEQFQPDIVIFSLTERAIGYIPSLFEK